MTFINEIKNEICSTEYKHKCCKRAFIAGLLCNSKSADGYRRFSVSSSDDTIIESIYSSLTEVLHCDVEIIRGNDTDRRRDSITVLTDILPDKKFDCDNCRLAYLHGVFLTSFTINDPSHANYHAELRFCDKEKADEVYGLLSECGCEPRVNEKNGVYRLYYKDGNAIEELLMTIGVQNSGFAFINRKIERNIRNDENRATNCVANNIAKAISASKRIIESIEYLKSIGAYELLPAELKETAILRCNNPSSTLDELAGIHNPPISKSGLNHRLRKIIEFAEETKNKQ